MWLCRFLTWPRSRGNEGAKRHPIDSRQNVPQMQPERKMWVLSRQSAQIATEAELTLYTKQERLITRRLAFQLAVRDRAHARLPSPLSAHEI